MNQNSERDGVTSENDIKPVLYRLPVWARVLVLLWFFMGSSPIIAQRLGISVLPSTDWVSSVRILAVATGFLSAALLAMAALLHNYSGPRWAVLFKKPASVIFSSFLGFLAGASVLVASIPMSWAIVAGSDVTLSFTVKNVVSTSDNRCANPIYLENSAVFYDRLCDSPTALIEALKAGDTVLVSGKGTPIGLLANSIRRAER